MLTAIADSEDIVFDKLRVNSQAILDLDQTLILSGLSMKESRTRDDGVPILKDIPGLRMFFSEKTVVETNSAIVILLTPRDPAFTDDNNRKARSDFVQMRRAFVEAEQGTEQDRIEFRKRYPNWQDLAPNRFASHFFLMEVSDAYRRECPACVKTQNRPAEIASELEEISAIATPMVTGHRCF